MGGRFALVLTGVWLLTSCGTREPADAPVAVVTDSGGVAVGLHRDELGVERVRVYVLERGSR